MQRPILYIHGFASSGRSHKATVLKAHFPEVYAPTLSHVPELAIETLGEFVTALGRDPLLVGSSLGGFYALHLSETLRLPAVLVNPVVHLNLPGDRLLGLHQSYFDGSRFEFTEVHLQSLARFDSRTPDQSRLLLLLQMGDELLDHRQTMRLLPDARRVVDPDGDHGFSHFERRIPAVREFLESH